LGRYQNLKPPARDIKGDEYAYNSIADYPRIKYINLAVGMQNSSELRNGLVNAIIGTHYNNNIRIYI